MLKLAVNWAFSELKLGGRTLKFVILLNKTYSKPCSSQHLKNIKKPIKFSSLFSGIWPFAISRLRILQIVNNFLPEVFTLSS